ncbi:conserved Plasmodium protein, unknown function [Plasmodium berghei]|uniref:Uncharacterized protein n=1 Tax=Plasmodium berghei TaxID=5821 RepID=A0A1D3LXI3_PLABE|nr:conserved Plasmodium protein, unknown function [Plasmodium berghei]
MDKTHNYTSTFYILDFNLCQNYSNKFWSFLKQSPTEDIIIISFKNYFEKELVHLVKLSLKNEIEWIEGYKFINLKNFENCPFIFLVKGYLYNEIHDVYFKNIQIATKKVYGKIYKYILKSYFYNFVKNKWNQIKLCENIQTDDIFEDNLKIFKEQKKKKKKKYVNKLVRYEYPFKNRIIHASSNSNIYNYSINKIVLINNFVDKNKHYSITHEKANAIKNLNGLLRTYSSELCYKKKNKDNNNYIYSYFGNKLYNKNGKDLNNFSCIAFKIKNTSLCVCLANIDLFEYVDDLNYYKYLFSRYRKEENVEKNKNAKSNYTKYCLNYYAMCCKQLYNYFINKLIFETQKKDIWLFNNDIIIFLGFEKNILIEKKKNEIRNIINDYSIFPDKNFIILNKKKKKKFIQAKAYSTLIFPDKGLQEFKLIGFRVICNLFMNIKNYNNMNNIHNNSIIKKTDSHIKKNEIKNFISLSPNFIDLNVIHTYQIYQTSFTLYYECNGITSRNIYISNINHKNNDLTSTHINANHSNTSGSNKVEKKHTPFNCENGPKAKREHEVFANEQENNNTNNVGTKDSQFSILCEDNLKKNTFDKWHTNISNIFSKKKNSTKSEIVKKNDNGCRSYEIKNLNPKNIKKNKDINIFCNNNSVKIGDTIPEKLYFSILCFDKTNNCTIPLNLYSFLHVKENSIFKYFEQNICFKNNKSNIGKKYYFDILRHICIYPYKGVLQPNSKQVIKLHIYIEHLLKEIKKMEGFFVIIIHIHNYMKNLFITFKYTLINNILFTFINENSEQKSVKQIQSKLNSQNEKIAKFIYTHTKANLSIHNQIKKTSYNLKQFIIIKKKYKKERINMKITVNKNNFNKFCSPNFEKLFLFLFFTLEHYEKKLHTNVDELEEDVFYFLKTSYIDNYNIIYLFDKFADNNSKGKIYNLNFMKKNCLFQEMYKGTSEGSSKYDMHKINEFILKIERNMKIDENISINLILFLCEELLYIINKSMIYFNITDYIRNIYNNFSMNKIKKMNIIFYNILKQSPSIFYKNIFLLFISFFKKLFFYFIQLSIHNFYVLVMKKTPYFFLNTLEKEKKKKEKIILNYYFHAFLHAFHFFYVSFLCYLSCFFLSFLDISIALDLAHHILFYM